MKLCVLFLCAFFAYGECIPNYYPGCQRSGPEIEKCILKGVDVIKPKLKVGIPEISLPPIDPFKIDTLFINSTISGAKIKTVLTDVVAHGGSDFEVIYLKVDLADNKYKMDLEIVFPFLTAMADYNTRGSSMLLFTINGRGKFKGGFKNVSAMAKCSAVPTMIADVEYLQLDYIAAKVNIDDGDLEVNPAEWSLTGSAASSFIKSSPSLVLKTFAPIIDKITADLVKKYVNDALATIPLKDILRD